MGLRCMSPRDLRTLYLVFLLLLCATVNPEVGYQTWIHHLCFCVAVLCLASGVEILFFWLLRVLALILEFQVASSRR